MKRTVVVVLAFAVTGVGLWGAYVALRPHSRSRLGRPPNIASSPTVSPLTKDAFVYDTQVPVPPAEYGIDLASGIRLPGPTTAYQLVSSNAPGTRNELNAQVKDLWDFYQKRMAADGWTITATQLEDTPTGDGVAKGSIDAGIKLTKGLERAGINVANWTAFFGGGRFQLNMTVLEWAPPPETAGTVPQVQASPSSADDDSGIMLDPLTGSPKITSAEAVDAALKEFSGLAKAPSIKVTLADITDGGLQAPRYIVWVDAKSSFPAMR
ncbi:MAG TPA: hypothetical protein DIT48_00605 [Actinobacteria bacterium]|jgi:hypothetical protein|nr:hypothetical protein [Actinomycetota bacterium]